jgi:AcrR family transcriptional regulator
MSTAQRRLDLKEALTDAAERAIAARGLGGLRARELAAEVGCAVGAIYNAVEDLDDLVLAVNSRTLAALEVELERAAIPGRGVKAAGTQATITRLTRMASAYLDYAAKNTMRWRALFEHRLPPGKPLPDWYLAEQTRLFGHVEEPVRELQPDLPPQQCALLARSLFSAVHGIVVLGLEEKLGTVPLETLRAQTTRIVVAIGSGLTAKPPLPGRRRP